MKKPKVIMKILCIDHATGFIWAFTYHSNVPLPRMGHCLIGVTR